MKWILGCGLAAGLGATALGWAVAADASTLAPGLKPPEWLHKPHEDDLMSVWPRKALDRGTGGKATIHCKVNTQGVLFGCAVVSEYPEGDGFGAAAIAITRQFQLKPALQDGVPVIFDGVTFPIVFPKPEAATGSHRSGVGYARPAGELLMTDAPWGAAPSIAEVTAAYPAKAREAKAGGRALIDCIFTGDAHLTGCQTMFEEPKTLGFGSAARSLAKSFVGPLKRPDGQPIQGARVEIGFSFAPGMADGTALVARPRWTGLPEAADFQSGFPAKARQAGVTHGRALLGCSVSTTGGLEACKVETEDQPGYGFGEAALALTPAFKMRLWSDDGQPMVGGKLRIPIRYELDDPAAAKP
jgi:TonB family protein